MPRFSFLLAALLTAAAATTAHAGRPLVTDDAGVLDRGTCEVEGVAERAWAGGDRATARTLEVGCGIGWRTQLGLAGGRAKAGGVRTDLATLSGKTALAGAEATGLTSLGYGVDATRARGGSWQHAASSLTLIHSRPLGRAASLHLNLGHARDEPSDRRATTWGAGIEHAGYGTLAPMAELYGDDREAPHWNVGLRWTLAADRVWLDASYGRQIGPGRARLATLGFKVEF